MKKIFSFLGSISLCLILIGCSGGSDVSIEANPGFHPKLHTIESEPLRLDEATRSDFELKLQALVEGTGLVIEDMQVEQIIDVARYYGYFGDDGKSIELYETALQLEKFQNFLAMHHNLGRAYEKIQAWEHAAGRYTYLINIGNANYQKDLEKVEEKIEK